jgi:hypothetical protein
MAECGSGCVIACFAQGYFCSIDVNLTMRCDLKVMCDVDYQAMEHHRAQSGAAAPDCRRLPRPRCGRSRYRLKMRGRYAP